MPDIPWYTWAFEGIGVLIISTIFTLIIKRKGDPSSIDVHELVRKILEKCSCQDSRIDISSSINKDISHPLINLVNNLKNQAVFGKNGNAKKLLLELRKSCDIKLLYEKIKTGELTELEGIDTEVIADIAFLEGDFHFAFTNYKKCIKKDPHRLYYYLRMADIYDRQGEYEEAETILIDIAEAAEEEKNYEALAVALEDLGYTYSNHGRLVESEQASKKALEIYVQLGILRGIASTSNTLGVINLTNFNYKDAKRFFQKAIKLYDRANDKRGKISSQTNLASVLYFEGNLEGSEKILSSLLGKSEKYKDWKSLADQYVLLGKIQVAKKNFEEALRLYKEAKELSKSSTYISGLLSSYLSLGNLYLVLGKYYDAMKEYSSGIDLCNQTRQNLIKTDFLINIGLLYDEWGVEYKHAESSYLEALEISSKYNYLYRSAKIHLNLAVLYNKQGMKNSVIEHLKLSLKWFEDAQNHEEAKRVRNILKEFTETL